MTTSVQGNQVLFDEVSAPSTPASGRVSLYAKADGRMYSKDDAGTETQLGGAGTVTSVALSMPAAIFDVAGSPITTSGTLAVTLDNQTANTVFAGPNTGSPAAPAFRALVSDDIPNLNASKITAGTLVHERGGLEADVSAYDGLIRIASGATTNLKSKFAETTAPTTGDDNTQGYVVGSRWIDTTNDVEYVCLDASTGAAVWEATTGGGGGTDIHGINNFRLTLTTAVPVTTTDVTSAGTLYLTPCGKGNQIGLYNGSSWDILSSAEVNLALTLTSGNNYDIFGYDNAGTLTLETLIWTNDTTRATALALQDGVLVKTGDLTKRYLGTLRASGSNVTEDSLLRRFLYNHYNQKRRELKLVETTNSWTYASASYGAWNGSTNNRVQFVVGVNEELIHLDFLAGIAYSATNIGHIGIGLDSTTVNTADLFPQGSYTSSVGVTQLAKWTGYSGIGFHYLQALQYSDSGTTTYFGDDMGGVAMASGMSGWLSA